jgi:hypothetical protein
MVRKASPVSMVTKDHKVSRVLLVQLALLVLLALKEIPVHKV